MGRSTLDSAREECWRPDHLCFNSWGSGSRPREASWEDLRLLPCRAPQHRARLLEEQVGCDTCLCPHPQLQSPGSKSFAWAGEGGVLLRLEQVSNTGLKNHSFKGGRIWLHSLVEQLMPQSIIENNRAVSGQLAEFNSWAVFRERKEESSAKTSHPRWLGTCPKSNTGGLTFWRRNTLY